MAQSSSAPAIKRMQPETFHPGGEGVPLLLELAVPAAVDPGEGQVISVGLRSLRASARALRQSR